MKKICLCSYCIEAIKSHGDRLRVGWETTEGVCEWCDEEDELTKVRKLKGWQEAAVIAAIVQVVEMVVEKFSPSLYASLGIFLPLIAVNCAILGGSLFMQQKEFENVGYAAIYALGSGIGWLFAIACIAAIREKMAYSNIPAPLKGLGITFIATGLMAIAFMSFSGIKL